MRHDSGQNVVPVFEGWKRSPDGSFEMFFGYMNRNYEEQPEIPIGPNNSISPGAVDQGQPTHFYPRRQQFMFKVRVPADFGKKELVWTLTRDGRTEKAYATLLLEEELTDVVISQNRGGIASDMVKAKPNTPPTIVIEGTGQRSTSVGNPLALTARAADDGMPEPPVPAPRRPTEPAVAVTTTEGPTDQAVVKPSRQGLAVTWIVWRGPGRVTFAPPTAVVKGETVSTVASFEQPGTYVIRAFADDGVLNTPADVSVTVAAR
jgi:hypothetical protein